MAEQVMRMPEPAAVSGGSPHIQRACPTCEEDELNRQPIVEDEEELQTKVTSGHISEATPNLESRIQSLKSGGQPLSENDRDFFEPRFGHDFSGVRVHSGEAAGQSARDLNANAYTVGRNIVFGAGRFEPGTHEGRRLIAHVSVKAFQVK
ncbi:MAG: DUF4157 domain-containing protein [Candidatus Methanoperedens sp.]|nr:DUF4157 domain-containing protein [Candidatus Methanoperedens sp.]MCZ7361588.1 DUF4157 domain-containing protein [Candidatus Methanoperedens sp.]HLB71699.1 DUF4157 domain-containing protein [Candidatus Methanoperedens sp.]